MDKLGLIRRGKERRRRWSRNANGRKASLRIERSVKRHQDLELEIQQPTKGNQ